MADRMDNTVVYMDTLCVDPLWNGTLTLQSRLFTHCFLHSVLSWPAPLLFIFMFLVKMLTLTNGSLDTQRSKFRLSFLFVLRAIGITSLTMLTLLLLIKNLMDTDHYRSSLVVLVSNSLRIFAYICAAILLVYERYKGDVTSDPAFLFWAVLTLTETLTLYERIVVKMYLSNLPDFIITTIIYIIIVFEFVLSFLADGKNQKKDDKKKKPWPEQTASFPSRIFFVWIVNTIVTAWRRLLTDNDLYELPDDIKGDNLVTEFDTVWKKYAGTQHHRSHICNTSANQKELHNSSLNREHSSQSESANGKGPKKRASLLANEDRPVEDDVVLDKSNVPHNARRSFTLLKTLLKLYGPNYFLAIFIHILAAGLSVIRPLIIRGIIETVKTGDELQPLWVGVVLCIAMLVSGFIVALLKNWSMYMTARSSFQVKSSLMSAIFSKAIQLNSEASKEYSAGEIMTLMSVDTVKVQEAWRDSIQLTAAPLQLIASLVLVYYIIGVSAVPCFIIMLLVTPANIYLSDRFGKVQMENMKLKDQRIKLTTDVLSGIRVLKLFSWETSFEEKISDIREKEMENLRKSALLKTAMNTINYNVQFFVTVATFTTYILISEDNHLDPVKAFLSLTYFTIMRLALVVVTFVMPTFIMSVVSMQRINKFLHAEDLDMDLVGYSPLLGSAVSMENATFAWEADTDPVLSDVSMHVPEGSLTMIVGKVGSGKSSLLSAILGELKLLSGTVDLKGSVAYVSQQAWIQHATVRDNILFGSRYEPGRYRAVVEACALVSDLSILPWGDQTEIGEKGINLSGGQKQRVALARAVYSDQDVYVLDDPLSAVDVHVGKHIFDRVLGPQGMLKHKTRILVSHGIQWLVQADQVIVILQGTVSYSGTYQHLLSQDSGFIHILKQADREEEEDGNDKEDEEKEGKGSEGGVWCEKSSEIPSVSSDRARHTDEPANQLEEGGKIIQEEKMQQGQVKLNVLLSWCKAGGFLLMALYFVITLLSQVNISWSRLWIRFWTADPYLANTSLAHTQKYADTNWNYLGFLLGFGGLEVLLNALCQIFFWVCVIRAAANLHRGMLAGVLKSPMSFFDTTPTGRMLNRFAEDTDRVDINFPWSFLLFSRFIVLLVGTIVVIVINVPLFITACVPIIFIFYNVVILYLPTARQLKRMDAVTKSPIYSHLSEAVGGVSTIRAFSQTSRFTRDLRSKTDDSVIRSLILQSCTSWLSLVTDLLSELLMFSAAIFAVLSTGVDGAATGLSIFFTIEFSWFLGVMVFQWMELTAHSVSIERIVEYSQLTPEEQHFERQSPRSWPSQGHIEFKDFKVKYRDELDLALKGVNAAINPGEKIGIVGRTGAGKSTMVTALFRLIEAAGGAIYIDDINIADLPLSTLRPKLSIIPQDPVLFSGTLHMNVDPHNEYTVDQVRRALVRSHLGEVVMYEEGGLSFHVGEQGNNLSVGQRQLVCLARALLRQNKILVLDEATAAIDVQTDSFIQETIRTDFRDCTVLTIAHRINTIMDYDRVMVLENGEVKEFAPLQDLLSNPDSLFYSLAKEAKLV